MFARKIKRHCLMCNNHWVGKTNDYYPHCPLCGTPAWDKGYNVKCEFCGRYVINPDIHHKDKNPRNNKLKNRMALCEKHHHLLHSIEKKSRIMKRKKQNYIPYKRLYEGKKINL